jgi:SanA protein
MIFRFLLFFGITAVVIFGLARLVMILSAAGKSHQVDDAPKAPVAIVFGAGLQRDGTPSPVLRDRVATAADLYFAGKVEKILMSGDNRFIYYNEPGSMLDYALSLGVPRDAIVLDYAGRRTYDTCYRAKEIFGVTDVLLVTQNFHLSRSLFTCDNLGLNAIGVSADRRSYARSSVISWEIRELPAALVAMWDVWVAHPEPVMGDKEPIFPDNVVSEINRGASHEPR